MPNLLLKNPGTASIAFVSQTNFCQNHFLLLQCPERGERNFDKGTRFLKHSFSFQNRSFLPAGMTKNLVIVESPTKAKMLSKFWEKNIRSKVRMDIFVIFRVKGRTESRTTKLPYASMAIDTEHGFTPLYVIPQRQKICAKLKGLLGADTTIWLASDEDREGEAIAWHLWKY